MAKISTRVISRMGIIAGLYTVISLMVFPISSGAIQVRISEALCVLPVFFPEAIIGLTVGCALSNLITGCAIFDIVLGSLVTFMASIFSFVFTRKIKREFLRFLVGAFFPVILNATLLPLIWVLCYGVGEYIYPVQMLLVLIGQAISVYGVGYPVYISVLKLKKKGVNFFN